MMFYYSILLSMVNVYNNDVMVTQFLSLANFVHGYDFLLKTQDSIEYIILNVAAQHQLSNLSLLLSHTL